MTLMMTNSGEASEDPGRTPVVALIVLGGLP